jgi:hypothetical protein
MFFYVLKVNANKHTVVFMDFCSMLVTREDMLFILCLKSYEFGYEIETKWQIRETAE